MLLWSNAVKIRIFLLVLALFNFTLRLPAIKLGLPPHIFVDEIFFFDDVYRHLHNWAFFPQSFISGALNEIPMWIVGRALHIIGIDLSYSSFLILGRLLLPVLLTSITVFPLYYASYILNRNTGAAVTSVILFSLSPWVFSNSQLWYPDHYIYFFVSIYLLQLAKLWEREISSKLPYFIGISLGLLISIKYTAFLFVIPLILVAKFLPLGKRESRNFFEKLVFKSILVSGFVFLLVNYSIFRYFHGFLQGMNSNRKNYRFFTNLPFENLFAYSELLLIFGVGYFGFLLFLLGVWQWKVLQPKFLKILLGSVLGYLLVLSSSPIMVPRNINLLTPVIALIAGAGVMKLKALYNKRHLLFYVSSLLLLLLTTPNVLNFIQSAREINRVESFELVKDFAKATIPSDQVVGTNPGSDGITPLDNLGYKTIPDPEMKMGLKYYVFSSYWKVQFGTTILRMVILVLGRVEIFISMKPPQKVHFDFFLRREI